VRRLRTRWQALTRKLPLSDGQWRYSRRTRRDDPAQGWKLHISATVVSASDVFAAAEPILRKHEALFKVPDRLELLISLNSGLSGFSQVGKFLTIYPRTTSEAVHLARELHRVTRHLEGPRIPFDAPYRKNSLVHYRYGAFRRLGRNSAGVIRGPRSHVYRDRRAPGRAVPRWLPDPFNRASKSNKSAGPIGVDYLAFKAKIQRGKGGVYEAADLSVSPARLVIIKEGRRHGETDQEGKDGYARVQHEAKVLRRLHAAGVPVPEVFREFSQDGNRYLVLEKVAGRPLIPVIRMHPARISWRRATKILDQLQFLLSRIHAAGWVWRDCKPSHILVHRRQFRLIDFENACRIKEKEISSWASRDYLLPTIQKALRRRAGTLEDDYALGVIAFQFLSGKFPPGSSRLRASIYKATRCPDSLRSRIESLLQV
jgi:serine/threonine protein kinase